LWQNEKPVSTCDNPFGLQFSQLRLPLDLFLCHHHVEMVVRLIDEIAMSPMCMVHTWLYLQEGDIELFFDDIYQIETLKLLRIPEARP